MGTRDHRSNRILTRFFAALLLCCTLPWIAGAQTTTVSGTVTDTNGIPYSGGQIKAQLVLAGAGVTGQPTVTVNNAQQCRSAGQGSAPCQVGFPGTQGPLALDNTGSFTISLQDNTLVTPAGTQWLFTVTTNGVPPPLGTGPQTCTATLTISGASQSVTSSLNKCPALATPGVESGGAGGPLYFLAAVFGVKSNGNVNWFCTWTINQPTITCPSGTFSQASVNNFAFASNVQKNGFTSQITSTVVCPDSTILSVTGTTTATLSANCIATSGAAGNQPFFWGPNDDSGNWLTALAAAWSVCGTLQGPAGISFVSQAINFTPPANCNQGTEASRQGFGFKGVDVSSTTIVMRPIFDYTTCGIACMFFPNVNGGNGLNLSDFTIWGAGFSNPTVASSHAIISLGTNGGNAAMHHVHVMGIGASSANLTGLSLPAGTEVVGLDYVQIDGAGSTACSIGSGLVSVAANGFFCGDVLNASLSLGVGAQFDSKGSTYGPNGQNSCNVTMGANVTFTSDGDNFNYGNGPANNGALCVNAAGAVANLSKDFIHDSGTGSIALSITNGGKVFLRDTSITNVGATSTGISVGAGSLLVDLGGNPFPTGTTPISNSGTIAGDGSITGTLDVAGNHVLTSGWGTANVNTVTGFTKDVKFTISVTAGTPAASPVLTDTFASQFWTTPGGGCSIIQIGGTFGVLTNPVPSSLSATGVAWTFSGTPVVGQSYTFTRHCGN